MNVDFAPSMSMPSSIPMFGQDNSSNFGTLDANPAPGGINSLANNAA